jgi:hypothetical protein
MKAKHILGSVVVAGMIVAAPAFGASAPPKGLYSSFDYVVSASGAGCVQTTGEFFGGFLSWPGAGKAGAVWRYQLPQGVPHVTTVPQVEDITYPATPAATSTTWSGAEKYKFEPQGLASQGTFDATLTYIDTQSFVMERTVTYTDCTVKINSSFVAE